MTERRVPGPMEALPPVRLPRLGRPFSPSATLAVPDTAAGGADATVDASSHPDAVKLQQLKDLLKGTPTGAEVVRYIEEHATRIEFRPGRASAFRDPMIVIGDDAGTVRAALALVHEVHHARTKAEGRAADVLMETRSGYVAKMTEDDVGARIDAIRTWNELCASKTCTGAFGEEYNGAYKSAVDALKQASPAATEAELTAAGEKAGHEAVKKDFVDGVSRVGMTRQTYGEYYGQYWDKRHQSDGQSRP